MVANVRVGLVQLRVRTNRTEENLAQATKLVEEAAAQGCALAVLPEAFAAGLNLPKSRECAMPIPGPDLEWVAKLASRHRIHIAAGLLEKSGDSVYSTAVLVDGNGNLVSTYRRINVYDLESYFITGGNACSIADTELGRIGMIAGYDIQFPETLRELFARGAEIIICPALLLKPFAHSIRQMALARAAENCCYLIFCSATGENTLAGLTYMGNSLVLQSPVGIRSYSQEFRAQEPVLAEAAREEQLITADLDLVILRRLQAANPLLRDFRRSEYCRNLLANAEAALPITGVCQ
jgi:predicted amidohydrolase